jgi:hypothetical protein
VIERGLLAKLTLPFITHCGFVLDNANAALGSNRDFFNLTLAIEEIEEVIHREISGQMPLSGAHSIQPSPISLSCRPALAG